MNADTWAIVLATGMDLSRPCSSRYGAKVKHQFADADYNAFGL